MSRSSRRLPIGGLPLAGLLGGAAVATLGVLPTRAAAQQIASTDTVAAHASETAASGEGRHRVRRGDTLWDLSASYLGTPWRWPELDRANKDVIRDPHWIYPGQRLRLPDGREITVGEDVAPRAADAVDASDEAADEERESTEPTTVFARRTDSEVGRSAGWTPMRNLALERVALGSAAEWYAAPFMVGGSGVKGAGELLGAAEVSDPRGSLRRVQFGDRVAITPPKGADVEPGAQYLLYTNGGPVARGHVLVPTAIATVERAGRKGVVLAKITRQYGVVEIGQGVMPLEAAPEALTREAPRTAGDATALDTKVAWVERGADLPTIQTRMILATKANDDVQVGDRFTLHTGREVVGRQLPDASIAEVRVVRVTRFGATAVVVGQDARGIAPGLVARRRP